MPDISSWDIDNPVVWQETVGAETVALSHPNYPATAAWDGNTETFKQIAAEYLAKVESILGLPSLFKPAVPGTPIQFRVPMDWLKLPVSEETQLPDESSSLIRYLDPLNRSGAIDRSLMLVAAETVEPNDPRRLGSRQGFVIMTDLTPTNPAGWDVHITGMARSLGLSAALQSRGGLHITLQLFYSNIYTSTLLNDLRPIIHKSAGLDADAQVAFDGVYATPADSSSVLAEIYATATRSPTRPASLPHSLTVRFLYDSSGAGQLEVEKTPLVANALPTETQDLFVQDPTSQQGLERQARPNCSTGCLDTFLEANVEVNGITAVAGNLTFDDSVGLVQVMQSVFVDKAADESQPETVAVGGDWHSRSNPFAAFSAYERARGTFDDHRQRALFDTIVAYGMPPSDYFRFATLPLLIRYRSGMSRGPGKDGRTVNAEVDYDPAALDQIGPDADWDTTQLEPVQVRFALADLKRSISNRDALGLACDPRWSWHEYCHVLLAGRTGRLELNFAHSAGDALAAIVSDPWSELAADPRTRGYTFPWVYLHRRHDRSVFQGWSWSGRRHRRNRFVWPNRNSRHKGYDSEQILSTTLFWLYRALGGDAVTAAGTAPDRAARQAAADYTLYLILRAIRMLPPAWTGLPQSPDQLAALLMFADRSTGPNTSGPLIHRVGGWAHKVVRWAFENQGLYATSNPADTIDSPGKPPPVDIFIDTNRPPSPGAYDRGGYMPVPLDWHGGGSRPWHAHPNSIIVAGGKVWVRVRNRGQTAAAGVRVYVWYAIWGPGDLPLFRDPLWNFTSLDGPKAVPAWSQPGVSIWFGPFGLPATLASGTRIAILAAADCATDPANINLGTALPCALNPTPVIDLVAGDNNLGLKVYVVP